ncbi:hypothetical protein Patl1_05588 [Pistacia atlantica]|uniref:Uncharacterized protein n=1 Tax=Pistacia atlantica TaxID=434234 RepID=A0ACC1BTD9_9ROSI|nr:hypothetical protein Patl1_05588 [Pistacia atlantica]
MLLSVAVCGIMSGTEDVKDQEMVDGSAPEESQKSMPSSQEEEAAVKKKYGGIVPKKPPLISKDHERAYFDSADWALGKQGVSKPKGPLEALRPKLQFYKEKYGLAVSAYLELSSLKYASNIELMLKAVGKPILWAINLRSLQKPTQQQTRYRKSPYAPSDGEDADAGSAPSEEASGNE